MADEKEVKEVIGEKDDNKSKNKSKSKSKNKKGILSRIWNSVFRLSGDDFEKRLQHISKEEATLLTRIKRRSMRWRKIARNLIIFSVILEIIAVGYAIMTTRSVDMDWKMRALRVLPMFLLPGLSLVFYSGLSSFMKMRDRKDQKTLERLRAERQAKIDELKERTNYYTTQQLIQRYDPDPAAKAAAASVLASKLGADSGLKMYLGDESQLNPYNTGKNNDVDFPDSTGLRKRNQSNPRSPGSIIVENSNKEMVQGSENSPRDQLIVEHHNPAALGAQDGGWIARLAALLVGEDPAQSYALICGNCHMHNGLARKEDFPLITYYCPHCHALNKPKESGQVSSNATLPVLGSPTIAESGALVDQKVLAASGSRVAAAAVEESEASERIVAEEPASH